MDGQFVPDSFGPEFSAKLRPHSRQHFDVHLMTQQPQNLIRQCVGVRSRYDSSPLGGV